MKKRNHKSSITKNNKIRKKKIIAFPLKSTYPLKLFLDLPPEIKKTHCGNIKRLMTLKY